MKVLIGSSNLELVQGDITHQQVDAIVNATNSELAGGGGVDGAIHRAAGPSVMEETRKRYPLGCPTGDAVVTKAGNLPVQWIFHAVGPIWQGGHRGEADQLRSVYRRCLALAVQQNCQSVAFPSISTGAYGYPVDLAAEQTLDEVRKTLISMRGKLLVRFVLYDAGALGAYSRVLEAMIKPK